jgi:hypothetical protein
LPEGCLWWIEKSTPETKVTRRTQSRVCWTQDQISKWQSEMKNFAENVCMTDVAFPKVGSSGEVGDK